MRKSTAIASIAALLLSAALVGCSSEEPGAAPKVDAGKSSALRGSGGKADIVQAKE
jgi:outer membrane protein assembly factor BamE (lipoprotein component of BamABCDE complex)